MSFFRSLLWFYQVLKNLPSLCFFRKCLTECHIPLLGHLSVHLSHHPVRSCHAVFYAGLSSMNGSRYFIVLNVLFSLCSHFSFVFSFACLFPFLRASLLGFIHLPVSALPASVHPSEFPSGQLLVVHRAVSLHVPRQLVCPHLSLLFPARLLGLPALRLRLHVSKEKKRRGWGALSSCSFSQARVPEFVAKVLKTRKIKMSEFGLTRDYSCLRQPVVDCAKIQTSPALKAIRESTKSKLLLKVEHLDLKQQLEPPKRAGEELEAMNWHKIKAPMSLLCWSKFSCEVLRFDQFIGLLIWGFLAFVRKNLDEWGYYLFYSKLEMATVENPRYTLEQPCRNTRVPRPTELILNLHSKQIVRESHVYVKIFSKNIKHTGCWL